MNWTVYFLFFPIIVIFATWITSKVMLRRADRTLSLPMPPIPDNPDPYEIAYLTYGADRVAEVMIVSLILRGYLQHGGYLKRRWYQKKEECIRSASSNLGTLTPPPPRWSWPGSDDRSFVESSQIASFNPGQQLALAERELFDWFSQPRTGEEVFCSGGPESLIKPQCYEYEKKMRSAGLLTPQNVKDTGFAIGVVSSLVIAGLFAWGLSASWETASSYGWWIFGLAVVEFLVLLVICDPGHLSALGREYLKRLKSRFENHKEAVLDSASPMLPLLVSLFGLEALKETEYSWIYELERSSEPSPQA